MRGRRRGRKRLRIAHRRRNAAVLTHGLNLGEVQVQEFGAPNDVLIRIAAQPTEKEQQDSITKVKQVLGDQVDYRRVEVVGPTVSSELIAGGTVAVVVAMIAILIAYESVTRIFAPVPIHFEPP